MGTCRQPHLLDSTGSGGVAVRSQIAPEIVSQFSEMSGGFDPWPLDFRLSWAPSGKAVYFERTVGGARSLWKMIVDPNTLAGTAIERLTTGSGLDTQLAVSADETKLAFTGETRQIRAWLFPFDASRGRIFLANPSPPSAGTTNRPPSPSSER